MMIPTDMILIIYTGWWFGKMFYFPYMGNNHPKWLSYFSEGLKPPTRLLFTIINHILTIINHILTIEIPLKSHMLPIYSPAVAPTSVSFWWGGIVSQEEMQNPQAG